MTLVAAHLFYRVENVFRSIGDYLEHMHHSNASAYARLFVFSFSTQLHPIHWLKRSNSLPRPRTLIFNWNVKKNFIHFITHAKESDTHTHTDVWGTQHQSRLDHVTIKIVWQMHSVRFVRCLLIIISFSVSPHSLELSWSIKFTFTKYYTIKALPSLNRDEHRRERTTLQSIKYSLSLSRSSVRHSNENHLGFT